jgi:hypothetical protein
MDLSCNECITVAVTLAQDFLRIFFLFKKKLGLKEGCGTYGNIRRLINLKAQTANLWVRSKHHSDTNNPAILVILDS